MSGVVGVETMQRNRGIGDKRALMASKLWKDCLFKVKTWQ
jgi:hypothetical protein